MNTFSLITIIVGIATIIVNILIAKYNVGKNRKIYGIKTVDTNDEKNVNKILQNEDYTILHVGPGKQVNTKIYVLGKLNSGGRDKNKIV